MSAFVGVIIGFFTGLLSVFGIGHTTSTLPQLPELDPNSVQQTIQQATNVLPQRATGTTMPLETDPTLEAGHEGPNTAQVALDGSLYVPGMSKYTDSDFGFSFWYPSGWEVTSVPVPTSEKYIGETNTITKRLKIITSTPNTGITINEIHSSNRSVGIGNAAKSGIYESYYFDQGMHAWMYSSTATGGGQTKTAADVSNNTMGGLHMFTGQGTFGENIAVPLSASNFVVSEASGEYETVPLLKTILATDPSVATPASAAQQTATIRAEQQAYAGQ